LVDIEEAPAPALPGDGKRRLTASSLYWFISSRHYVPIAEIRRRFQLDATDGTLLSDDDGIIHIGLPDQAARALLDLKKKGKIGLEFAPEYELRIVVGAYPMRVRPPETRKPDKAA